MVQISDARRSIKENLNIKRLTLIAMVFIPLSYVATLFSMGDKYAPGQDGFWLYFAVSIPTLLLVFLAVFWPHIWGPL
ncbi:hypothetical protein F4778DRAFT_721213, partial [Xylariomycetidae sp. FL2044]